MGNADKSQVGPSGRVPLVQDGKPLLYPRYNTVDDLAKLAKGSPSKRDVAHDADGVAAATTERPNKKQKRSSSAATSDAVADAQQPADASAPVSIYAVVGEDGLTYKQRRQLRRAQERAAKEQAQAVADAAKAEAAKREDDGTGAATEDAPQPAPVAETDKPRKKSKKGSDSKADEPQPQAADGAAVPEPPAAPAAKGGNADEAARMRAVFGFTGGASGGAGGAAAVGAGAGLSLASLVQTAAANGHENGEAGPGADSDEEGKDNDKKDKEKDEKKDKETDKEENKKKKKEKKEKSKVAVAEEAAAGQQQSVEGQAAGSAMPVAVSVGPAGAGVAGGAGSKGAKGGDTAARDGAAGTSGRMHFSFDFKVQAAVEAETEAKVARLMALDATKDGFVPRRVWVCGLPHEYDEDNLREYWSYCGEIEDMHCLAFPDSGNFNGTAFLTFKTQEGYEAALACHGEMLEGRALRVEKCKAAAALKCKARSMNGSSTTPGATPVDATTTAVAAAAAAGNGSGGDAVLSKKGDAGQKGGKNAVGARVPGYPVLYVGNVAFEAGAEQLSALFAERVGTAPSKVRLHTDLVTGRSKGFAHVHFTSEDDVDKALTLDGTNLHGRKIRVSYAQPKPGEV